MLSVLRSILIRTIIDVVLGGEQETVGCIAITLATEHQIVTLLSNYLCLLSSLNTCHVEDVYSTFDGWVQDLDFPCALLH